jgi:hypothetical protein
VILENNPRRFSRGIKKFDDGGEAKIAGYRIKVR